METGVSCHIIIVGVTANSEGEARVDCIESGMDGFMEKPLRIQQFQDCISKFNLGPKNKAEDEVV